MIRNLTEIKNSFLIYPISAYKMGCQSHIVNILQWWTTISSETNTLFASDKIIFQCFGLIQIQLNDVPYNVFSGWGRESRIYYTWKMFEALLCTNLKGNSFRIIFFDRPLLHASFLNLTANKFPLLGSSRFFRIEKLRRFCFLSFTLFR